jgi:hypothetical protein
VLEEEIQTTIYITKHSDLSSDEEDSGSDEPSDLSLSSSDESEPDATPIEETDVRTYCLKKKRKARSDRQIEAAAIRDCIGDAERIKKRLKVTPDPRRKRRRRQWEWTLEPLKDTSPHADGQVLAVSCSDISPSRIPLPPSATLLALDTKAALRSPSPAEIAMPPSAATSPLESPPKKPRRGNRSTQVGRDFAHAEG